MTDLEMTKLCAQAMGFDDVHIAHGSLGTGYVKYGGRRITQGTEFRPLQDDAQAMALVKRLHLFVTWHEGSSAWCVDIDAEFYRVYNADLNRAICECVAKYAWKETPV